MRVKNLNTRADITNVLETSPWITLQDLCHRLRRRKTSIAPTLSHMVKGGQVVYRGEWGKRQYKLADES